MDGFVDNWQLQDSFRFSQSIRDSLGSVVFEMYPGLTRLLFARCLAEYRFIATYFSFFSDHW